jgi:hypothetical protein
VIEIAHVVLALVMAAWGATGLAPEEDDPLVPAVWAASAIIAEQDSYCGGVAVPLFERYDDGSVWVGITCSGPEEWSAGVTAAYGTFHFESHAP